MVYALLFIVTLSALAAALCFKEKVLAASMAILVIGCIYFFRGVFSIMGTSDEQVASDDMTWIYTGLGVVVVGVLLFVAAWFLDVRVRNPRR